MSDPDVIIPARLLAQMVDALSAKRPSAAKMRSLVAEVEAYRDSGNTAITPWAICEGGLIQDSSEGLEYTDLDWMDHDGPLDLDEIENSWTLLTRVITYEGHDSWADALHEIEETLTSMYREADTPEERKVWNR